MSNPAAPRTSRNRKCTRYILIRYVQFEVHRKELDDGIKNARSSINYGTITERGKEMAKALNVNALRSFAEGRQQHTGAYLQFGSPKFQTDGSFEAIETLNLILDSASNNESGFVVEYEDRINPVYIVGSADYINRKLQDDLNTTLKFDIPLGSISMYDVFEKLEEEDAQSPPFIHCIGNTALYPDIVWWCNSK